VSKNAPSLPAHFITFEGGEGSGKSTQARLLAERLKHAGVEVLLTREPGGSPFAEQVRDFILGGRALPHPPLAEALLFYAARADHLATVIVPALTAGKWVISDRFSDSTRVYQGVAGGVPAATIEGLDKLVVGPHTPALTIIMDISPDDGLRRAALRRPEGAATDPFEARTLAFHGQLRDGFRALAAREAARCVLVDGAGPAAPIAATVWKHVEARLLGRG
jgi:dTMP kinase